MIFWPSRRLVRASSLSHRNHPALRFPFAIGIVVSTTLLLAAASARAQEKAEGTPGTVISTGSQPFTDTFAQIVKRDAPNQKLLRAGKRLPFEQRVIDNVFGDDLEKAMGSKLLPGKDETPVIFPLVPFIGGIDKAGHFISQPGKTVGTQDTSRNQLMVNSGTSNAPQGIGAVGIDGLRFNTTAGYIPPDTQGAVGPNHAMIFVNASLAIYNKSNGAYVANSQVTLDSFFVTIQPICSEV